MSHSNPPLTRGGDGGFESNSAYATKQVAAAAGVNQNNRSARQQQQHPMNNQIMPGYQSASNQSKGFNLPSRNELLAENSSHNVSQNSNQLLDQQVPQGIPTTGMSYILKKMNPNQQAQLTTTQALRNNEVSMKKPRKLRKNFDMLAQVMKQQTQQLPTNGTFHSAKGGDRKAGSSNLIQNELSRNIYGSNGAQALSHIGPSQLHQSSLTQGVGQNGATTIPNVFSQVNIVSNINQKNGGALSAHAQQSENSHQLLGAYGAVVQYGLGKERKQSSSQGPQGGNLGYYEINSRGGAFYSHSQRQGGGGPSQSNSQRSVGNQGQIAQNNLIYNGVNSLQPLINNQHTNSLFSHISLKDNSPQKVGGKQQFQIISKQSRNPSLKVAPPIGGLGNPHQTQQIPLGTHNPMIDQASNQPIKQQFLRTNITASKKMAGRRNAAEGVSSSRKSSEQLTHPQLIAGGAGQPEKQQPILNINTASDINIYNNSFIVNTNGLPIGNAAHILKKQNLGSTNSQINQFNGIRNQNRSNSQKRGNTTFGVTQIKGGGKIGSNVVAHYQPGSKGQLTQGGLGGGLNSTGNMILGNQGGISLQNLFAMNNEYTSRMAAQGSHSRSHQQRSNSRLSSTGQDEQLQRATQDAYSAKMFGSGLVPPANPQQQQALKNDTNSKKMIKMHGRKSSSKQQHLSQMLAEQQTTRQQFMNQNLTEIQQLLQQQQLQHQQSYTQSFDLHPFNSSQDLLSASSICNNLANRKNGSKFQQNLSTQKAQNHSQSLNRMKRASGMGASSGGETGHKKSTDELSSSSKSGLSGGDPTSKGRYKSLNLTMMGKKKVLEKDYAKAIQFFSEAVAFDYSNQEALFYRALCRLDSGSVNEAILELKAMIDQHRLSDQDDSNIPTCHILLSIAYNRLKDSEGALDILRACITAYPNYPDAYQARGQALLMKEDFKQALLDFSMFTQLVPGNGMGHVGMGDCSKALRQWPAAIKAYTKALQLFQMTGGDGGSMEESTKLLYVMQTTLKRGLVYYYSNQYTQATVDLQQVLKYDGSQIKAHFYIGKILSKRYQGVIPSSPSQATTKLENDKKKKPPASAKLQNEAILHFEQVVKYHKENGEVYAGNALFEISKLRLHDKDFYEAWFNLKRAVDSNFTSKRLQLYMDFVVGVLYLIKRKIKKGIQILNDLLEVLVNQQPAKKDQRQMDFLKHQSFIYRAYGYVAIEKYEVALHDIKRAKKIAKLDAATIYNKHLGKGILRMDHEDYIMATKYFTKASNKFNTNKDPYCLQIISIVRSYSFSHAGMSIDQQDKQHTVFRAKDFMDHAIRNCDMKIKVPSLYFFRGLLHFQLHMFYQALNDFNVAISEEEEPTASYYLARGRTYACLSILSEAMKDLSIALNLDETLQEAYIYRGKCAYLLGDNNLAFMDFQRLILTDSKNPIVHVYAGNLLMTTGNYSDAIKAFLNADTVQKTAIAAFQRARCYCALTDLQSAKMQFKIASQICKGEQLIQIDSQILSALMKVINATKQSNMAQGKHLDPIQEAVGAVTELIQVFQSDKIKNLTKKDCPLNIQIIPNVKRIKVEKMAVAKELYIKQAAAQQASTDKAAAPDLSIATDVLMAANPTIEIEALKDVTPLHSYYYENVFSLEDLYLFRAVFHFYGGNQEQAIADYLRCQEIKYEGTADKNHGKKTDGTGFHTPNAAFNHEHCNESIRAYSQSSTPMLSMNSSRTDLSDVGLCSLNVHETNYNIMLCYLMKKEFAKAVEKINEIVREAPGKYQRHFFIIRGLIYEQLGQYEKARKDFAMYQKSDPKSFESFYMEGKDLVFEPFPIKNRLCSKFDFIRYTHLTPSNFKSTQTRPVILFKPSFSMPFIKPPNMIPNIDEESIQNEFTLKQIDAPMPEAPWIRRWGGGPEENDPSVGGIKFTDNILMQEEDEPEQSFDMSEEGKKNHGASKKAGVKGKRTARLQYSQDKIQVSQKSGRGGGAQDSHKDQHDQSLRLDQSPYIQSIEVPIGAAARSHHPRGITEHLIKNIGSRDAAMPNAMMVYQFVGDALDVDQFSDKHKISLFDDSRYDELGVQQTIEGGTIGGQSIDTKSLSGGHHVRKRKILKQDGEGEDPLGAGDSLYDENLLNDDSKDSDDSSSSSSSNEESSTNKNEERRQMVDNSMVNIGEIRSALLGGKKKATKKGTKHPHNVLNPLGGAAIKGKRDLTVRLGDDANEMDDEEEEEEARESIFRSRQSTKR